MTWISFFTTSYRGQTGRHNERSQPSSAAARQIAVFSGSSISRRIPSAAAPRGPSSPQQGPILFERFNSLTFSFRLLALMTFAANVRPEEFSTHLCTCPKRPLTDGTERGRETGITPVLHPGNTLEKGGPADLCFNDKSKSDLRFNRDVLLC